MILICFSVSLDPLHEATVLVHAARYALWNIARKRSETTHRRRYQTTLRGRGAARVASPHARINMGRWAPNLVRAGERVSTCLQLSQVGELVFLGEHRSYAQCFRDAESRVHARALARGHVRLRQLHSTNTALRSPYLVARCIA